MARRRVCVMRLLMILMAASVSGIFYLLLKEGRQISSQYNSLESIISPLHIHRKMLPSSARTALEEKETKNDRLVVNFGSQNCKNDCVFQSFDVDRPRQFHLTDPVKEYLIIRQNVSCVTEGTLFVNKSKCVCKIGWHGPACGWPAGFHESAISDNLILRKRPRRLIQALPFNMEFEMLEARFSELDSVVDVFVILESNYSAYGDTKPLRLLDALRKGFCKDVQHKIVYILLGYFPKAAYQNGWVIDDLLRDHIAEVGLKKQVTNIRNDDLFVLSDADEIPRKHELLFLKLHDGFPEPVGFYLHFTTYGFFYGSPRKSLPIIMAVTVGFLYQVLEGKASRIRNPDGHLPNLKGNIKLYESSGHRVKTWLLGDVKDHVGWHCSWCFKISSFPVKLKSAQRGDFPRWGDYPEKMRPEYLKSLVRKGSWFDGTTNLFLLPRDDPMFAPSFFLANPLRFHYLLKNIYK